MDDKTHVTVNKAPEAMGFPHKCGFAPKMGVKVVH